MLTSLDSLTDAERTAALDVGQLALDVVGIFEPTLLARLLNALGWLPLHRLSPVVRDAVLRMDRAIRDFLPETMWALSHVADTWTTGRRADIGGAVGEGQRRARPAAEMAAGGGSQYFLPRAWDMLE